MLKPLKQLEKLCTPALLYFVFSIVAYVAMLTQNFGNKKKYCFGPYECNVPNTFLQDPSRNVQGNPFDSRILGSVYNQKG